MSMEKHVLSFTKVKGSIIYGFSSGVLVFYHNEAEMDSAALEWMFDKLPLTPEQLRRVAAFMNDKGRHCKVELIPPDTSFEAFWSLYNKKVNRKRCEPLWDKLSEPERIQCILSIKPYDLYLQRMNGRAKLDPENYLKRRAFENNWNTLNS